MKEKATCLLDLKNIYDNKMIQEKKSQEKRGKKNMML